MMLRPFAVEAAGLARRAAHNETACRDANHLGAVGTFPEFALGVICGNGLCTDQKRDQAHEKPKRWTIKYTMPSLCGRPRRQIMAAMPSRLLHGTNRAFRRDDLHFLYRICLATGDAGADARHLLPRPRN